MNPMEVHPLRAFRERNQLSQAQLADLLGVERPSVTRWENGTRKVDPDKLTRILEKTGIPPRELRPDLAAMFSEAAE